MATVPQRIFAGFFAILFLLSASALTIAVVVQSHQSSNSQNQTPKNLLQGKPLANFKPIQTIPQLQTIDLKVGKGQTAKPGDDVTVDYTGAVAATGIVFQSSKDTGQPVPLSLKQVIAGWSQGVPGMKEGGTRRLLIPGSLAYGPNPPQGSGIPPNADLVFDITLQKVGK